MSHMPPMPASQVADLLDQACEDATLSDAAFRALFVVARGVEHAGRCCMTDTAIGRLSAMSRRDARRAVREADRRGYVVQRFGPDGRFRTTVELTRCTKYDLMND